MLNNINVHNHSFIFKILILNISVTFLLLLLPSCYGFKGTKAKGEKITTNLSPVILVPGDGGCQIEAKWAKPSTVEYLCTKTEKSWSNLWLTIADLSPYIVNCLVDNMRLVYNNITRTTSNTPGVETRIPGFGDTATVEYLDPFRFSHFISGYFDKLVAQLTAMGYKRKETLRGAPFDFRKAPNELSDFYGNLTKLIEDCFAAQNTKVTLIAHSMGAPLIHYLFIKKSQQWKDKYIQSVISLAGAWGGSVKPIKVYAVGDDFGYRLIESSKVKYIQRSLPSLAFLMPSRQLWPLDYVLVQTPNKNYSLSNIEEYFDAIPFHDGYEMYKDTRDLLYNAPPPGVEVHCLHGLGVATTERVIYKTTKDFPLNPFLFEGDGDGTVNKKSAESCLLWSRRQKQKIYHSTFPKVGHMGILTDSHVHQYITDYLKEVELDNQRRVNHPNSIWRTRPEPSE